MRKIHDYILDQQGVNWRELLLPWAWLLPGTVCVWIATRIGDLILVFEDGSVHMLDTGRGSLERIAASRAEFADLCDQDQNAEDWLAIPLVDDLVAAGHALGPGQCYSYRELPLLGGSYDVENFRVVTLAEHFKALGPIHEALKDVPDGTHVVLKADG